MIKEDLSKVVDLQEELGNPLITIHKPRTKENIKIFESDTAAFDIVDDNLIFDFWELEGFIVGLDKIKSVITETINNLTIINLNLKYGNTIMLNFIK